MNKIHTVSALPVAYTLTGSARDASVTVSQEAELPMQIVSRSTGDSAVKFNPGAPPRFTRARLIPNGAIGLNPPVDGIAADLVLVISGDSTDYSVTRKLSFVKWNEWEDKLVSFGNLPDVDTYTLNIGVGSVYRMDDFNLAASFVGEDVCPMLELEWDNGAFSVDGTDVVLRV